ncbi:MAG: hypothetical protein NUV65_05945 [Candidatus Roizmanbacteria bacterium]|nr:hypothetical protein [Candidatus Roizmanbacteria bacterium]
MIFTVPAFAQFQTAITATVDSGDTISTTADMLEGQLISVTFPSHVTDSLVIIQHSDVDTSGFTVAYFDSLNTPAVFNVVARPGATVAVNREKTYFLKRYLRVQTAGTDTLQTIFKLNKK